MTYKAVLQWPDKRLNQVSHDIVNQEDFSDLMNDMIDTLKIERGAGLAAPQIGIFQNIIVIDIKELAQESPIPELISDELIDNQYWFLLNPMLVVSDGTQSWTEGCLSVPWVTAEVERFSSCTVSYLTKDFEKKELNIDWPIAGALQHECDHLVGKLFLNRLSRLKARRLTQFISKRRRKIEHTKSQMFADLDEKKVGGKKRYAGLGKKEIKNRKKRKKMNRAR